LAEKIPPKERLIFRMAFFNWLVPKTFV
jgi:hypothetical protein